MPATRKILVSNEHIIADKEEHTDMHQWQEKEVRRRAKDAKKNPGMLVDEAVVFNMLKPGKRDAV